MLNRLWDKVRVYLLMSVCMGSMVLLGMLVVWLVVRREGIVNSMVEWWWIIGCMTVGAIICIWIDLKSGGKMERINVEKQEEFEREWKDKVANIKSGDTVKIREDLEQRQRCPSRLPGGYCIYTSDKMLDCKGKEAKVLDKCIDLLVLDILGMNSREDMWHVWQVDKV